MIRRMPKMKGSQSQFEIMIEYMERHGDMCKIPPTARGRSENDKKWNELARILNSKVEGNPKPLKKWRKAWSDFKSNTRKKLEKILENDVDADVDLEMSELETRALRLIGHKRERKGKSYDCNTETVLFIKQENVTDPPVTSTTPPPYFCNVEGEDTKTAGYKRDSDPQETTTPPYFCSIAGDNTKISDHNRSASSCSSSDSASPLSNVKKKRRLDNLKELTETLIQFEREKERKVHEREMMKIEQNKQLIGVFNRMVNVLESLAPSIQRCCDRICEEGVTKTNS